jgi:hypothetical protein
LFQDTVLGSFYHQFFSESEVLVGSAENARLCESPFLVGQDGALVGF